MAEEEKEQKREPLDVYEVLTVMLDQMAAIAWAKLGLQPDPIAGVIAADLDQAKAAIDVAASLASAVEANLDAGDRTQVQSLIRDLRLNYVQKRSEAKHE